mmetsp:Transcript_6953/g.9327  ORF Transcript_6953/g.9327 Transcript_6953/m.9327 type:complete len:264 (+) Transcript_6953:353-1144(+)
MLLLRAWLRKRNLLLPMDLLMGTKTNQSKSIKPNNGYWMGSILWLRSSPPRSLLQSVKKKAQSSVPAGSFLTSLPTLPLMKRNLSWSHLQLAVWAVPRSAGPCQTPASLPLPAPTPPLGLRSVLWSASSRNLLLDRRRCTEMCSNNSGASQPRVPLSPSHPRRPTTSIRPPPSWPLFPLPLACPNPSSNASSAAPRPISSGWPSSASSCSSSKRRKGTFRPKWHSDNRLSSSSNSSSNNSVTAQRRPPEALFPRRVRVSRLPF